MKYIIGTRGSKLALAQANEVCGRLKRSYPNDEFKIQIIKTKGDLILDIPLREIGDKGLFTTEIEKRLLSGEIQLAVHSMKDMPSIPAPGLVFAKAWKREDPRDALILREKRTLADLPEGARIGTGSRRRELQLKRLRADLEIVGIRGNVETRLRKMEEEKLDGIVLAAAGLHRLGLKDRITCYFEPEEMIPAPAQGVLALELKEGQERLLSMLNALSDEPSWREAKTEREFLRQMGGSCHIPVGAVCEQKEDRTLMLSAMFGTEDGSRQAYVSVRGRDPEALSKEAAALVRKKLAGTVFLIGAGPGDPELITVRGRRILREADCIVYDRLASPELLAEAKDGCEMIYVGKENRNHTMSQEEINALLVQKSMEYKTVVRLKGGDVFVFGRGGEEALFLKENGVPFEVVPGISSSIAGPAYAGIPITHRGRSIGFHVVTAHDRNDALADIDFEAMAKGKETCVFLMGLSKIREIADRLMAAGMPKETCAAVISKATTAEQRTCVSDLSHIADDVADAGFDSPAVIVAGNVVSLRDRLNFFEGRPLFGKRYLIPKIGREQTRLHKLLTAQGAAADEIMVGRIKNVGKRFVKEQLEEVDWLIFTSRNGVESFFCSLFASGLDVRSLSFCRVASIGGKTADALRRYGIVSDLVPEENCSDALILALKERLSKEQKVWYLKAENADSHMKDALFGFCELEEVVVYENCAVEADLANHLPFEAYDGVFFTCASSVDRLAYGAHGWQETVTAYSIGPKTTACLHSHGVSKILEAKPYTYEGLVSLCLRQVEQK